MALTPSQQAELDAARAALARINSGEALKRVTHGSRSRENHLPDPAALQRQIDQLEALAAGGRRRGALTFRA